jgi:AraC family transcriptional regulator
VDWVERINAVVDYIEGRIESEEPIDEIAISKIAACSFGLFQGSFAQMSGISLSEYARRRKLTLAAHDLQNTDAKVTDVAMKYGYQSADAFSVAFKRLHGISPMESKKPNMKLTFYCRLRFALTIQGVDRMDYTIIERGVFNVAGIRRTTPYGGGTWAIVKSDGGNDRANELFGKFYALGLCFGFGDDGSNDYMCAVEHGGELPDGLDSFSYPAATWLKFEAKGTITGNTLGNVWQRINNEFLPQSKYEKSELPTIEKYVSWDEAANLCNVEIWIPVAMK